MSHLAFALLFRSLEAYGVRTSGRDRPFKDGTPERQIPPHLQGPRWEKGDDLGGLFDGAVVPETLVTSNFCGRTL
jgi:hypothetical protein